MNRKKRNSLGNTQNLAQFVPPHPHAYTVTKPACNFVNSSISANVVKPNRSAMGPESNGEHRGHIWTGTNGRYEHKPALSAVNWQIQKHIQSNLPPLKVEVLAGTTVGNERCCIILTYLQ